MNTTIHELLGYREQSLGQEPRLQTPAGVLLVVHGSPSPEFRQKNNIMVATVLDFRLISDGGGAVGYLIPFY